MKKCVLTLLFVFPLLCAGAQDVEAQACTNVRGILGDISITGQYRYRMTAEDLTGCDIIESNVWFALPFGCLYGSSIVDGACQFRKNGTYQYITSGARMNGCGAEEDVYAEARGHVPNTIDTWATTEIAHFTTTAPCAGPPPEYGCEWIPDEYEWSSSGYWSCSPIVIYTGPREQLQYRLSSLANGVTFDLDADGVADQVSWTRRNDPIAFLAMDRNGNGTIDNGSELFGSNTLAGAGDGFTALKLLARQANGGVIRGNVSALDGAFYDALLLWTDRNHDGFSQPSELAPFKDQFSSITFSRRELDREDRFGNAFRYKGYVQERTAPGLNPIKRGEVESRNRKIFDVFLVKQ